MIGLAKRDLLDLTKVCFLLAIMVFSSAMNTEQALAVGASQQPECNETNSKTGTATPQPSTSTVANGQTTNNDPPEVCYDAFLWLQNDINYYEPCASGSGGSNGSNNNKSNPTPDGKWVYPVGEGSTVSDVYGSRGGDHHGMDIAAPDGTPIYAAHSGKVVAAGPASGFGNWIVIESDDGSYSTVYGHMWDHGVDVSVGQHVNAGDQIGKVGSNGQSSGPHLHFEVHQGNRLNGSNPTDPAPYLEGAGKSTATAPVAQQQSSQNTCCSTSQGASTPTLAGSNNAEKVWNYLISQGLTPEQAAAVMGNLAWESGDPSFDKATSAEEMSGGGGFGIGQWTGGRRTAIEQAATTRANNANLSRDEVLLDLGFQLEYLVQESKGRTQRDGGGNEWEGLKEQKSIEDANYYWMHNFERPGDLREAERLAYAKEYYQKYTGKSPNDPAASTSGNSCSNSNSSSSEAEKKA